MHIYHCKLKEDSENCLWLHDTDDDDEVDGDGDVEVDDQSSVCY